MPINADDTTWVLKSKIFRDISIGEIFEMNIPASLIDDFPVNNVIQVGTKVDDDHAMFLIDGSYLTVLYIPEYFVSCKSLKEDNEGG